MDRTEQEPAAPAVPEDPAPEEHGGLMARRTFVVRAIGLVGAAATAALAIPVAGFATAPGYTSPHPLRILSTSIVPTLRSDEWTPVGALADFTVGQPRYVQVERTIADGWVGGKALVGVHVVRLSDTEFQAFDPHCTHLGCPLAWSDGASTFVCPCHGGSFDVSGKVVSGPPPRALFAYETRVVDGIAEIGKLREDV